ncbi:MAG: tetratricopeptide repeat protein [Halothece sp. Uz-M2-17]|nr:tetratricopeptide repeat protein [Halothece sp. Uz-M2-17]
MKQLIPVLFGISVLITPQFSVIADETNREIVYSQNEPLLSRAAHYKAWTMRGNEALNSGNYDRAIALYDQAIALDTDQPLAWQQRGDALAKKGQYQAAIEAYNEALNLSDQKQPQLQEKIETVQEKRLSTISQ